MKKTDVLIIGAGPCGIGAALKLKEANVDFLIMNYGAPGGKINIAPRVDNYPRQTKIPGPDLAFIFYQRLIDNNIDLISDRALDLTKKDNLFYLKGENDEYIAKAVLLASGTKERKLGLPKEEEFLGHGISYCSVCDGHFFKNKDVVVVGGGNSALKESIHLADICSQVYLVHRRNQFRGLGKTLDELKSHENIKIFTPYVPVEIMGEEKVEGLKIRNVETEEIITLKVDGFFPLVGQLPNTEFIHIDGVKNEYNNVIVEKNMATSCPGLFAGGDILPRELKQIYLSEHDGMVAAESIKEYLSQW